MKMRHYERSIIAAVPIAIVLAIVFLALTGAAGFAGIVLGAVSIPPAAATIIGLAFIVGPIVSGASYIGRALDAISKSFKAMSHEGRATIVGIALGLAAAVTLICTGISIPFLAIMPVIPQLMMIIGCIGTLAGLCARIGRVIDRKVAKEKKVDNQLKQADNVVKTTTPAAPKSTQFDKRPIIIVVQSVNSHAEINAGTNLKNPSQSESPRVIKLS